MLHLAEKRIFHYSSQNMIWYYIKCISIDIKYYGRNILLSWTTELINTYNIFVNTLNRHQYIWPTNSLIFNCVLYVLRRKRAFHVSFCNICSTKGVFILPRQRAFFDHHICQIHVCLFCLFVLWFLCSIFVSLSIG